MRTRTSALIGATLALMGLRAPALAADGAPGTTLPIPMVGKGYAGGHNGGAMRPGPRPGMGNVNRWGPHQNGRWYAGWRAPGGWNAYRRPVYGYVLPRYWVQPSYTIVNYAAYGFPAPAAGYGWSRYYDDAVMTDRYGRVYDSRSDVDWDRDQGADDDRRGPPPRYEGRRSASDYEDVDDGVTYGGDYQGRWSGTWHGKDGTSYSGDYEGTYRGTTPGVRYDAPPYDGPAHHGPSHGHGAPYPVGGHVANGWYYPAPTITTVTVQPSTYTTTTTTYVTDHVRVARPARKARRCNCK